MKSKNKIIGVVFFVLVIIFISLFCFFAYGKNNLIKLDYDDVIEKINNNDSFVLCISRKECVHCDDFKPKLKKIANQYDIKIYYSDVDLYNKEDYDNFKRDFSFDGSTPTTIFIIDGEEKTTATRISGDVSTEKVITKLKNNGFIE